MANNHNRFSDRRLGPAGKTYSGSKRGVSLDGPTQSPSHSLRHSENSSGVGDLWTLPANYLRWHRVENYSPLTVRDYQDEPGAFLHSLENRWHSLKAQDVTPFDIMVFLEELKNRGQAPATLKRTYGNPLARFNWMVRWDFLSSNPVRKVSRPKEPKVKKGFLAPEHVRGILELCPQGHFQGARRRATQFELLTKLGEKIKLFRL